MPQCVDQMSQEKTVITAMILSQVSDHQFPLHSDSVGHSPAVATRNMFKHLGQSQSVNRRACNP